jgi:hypothetical protein
MVDLALIMVGRAALALERNSHSSGAQLWLDLERTLTDFSLEIDPDSGRFPRAWLISLSA